jgi:hypothetical protein
MTPIEISRELGISRSVVAYQCLRNAADPPRPRGLVTRRSGPVMRGGRAVHPYSIEDDALILRLEASGMGNSKIARALSAADPARPRKTHSILGRLMTLARHARMAEEE